MRVGHILVCHTVSPERLLSSVPTRSNIPWFVFLHGQDNELNENVSRMVIDKGGIIFPYKTNRGLSKSWNEGIRAALADGCDAVWLLNDDLYFYDGAYDPCLAEIESLLDVHKDAMMVSVRGLQPARRDEAEKVEGQGFSCGLIPKSTLDIVGAFDENFYPAYYEDSDYFKRCVYSGLSGPVTEGVYVVHDRSKTVNSFNAEQRQSLHEAMIGSGAYLRRKWGDETTPETFKEPFGQTFGLKISFENSRRPYGPGFDRDDENPFA